MSTFFVLIGFSVGSLFFGAILIKRKKNLEITKYLEENNGIWVKEKIPINPNIRKRSSWRRSRFKSQTTGKFVPYDNLQFNPEGNFVEIIYKLASGRPCGYRIERIAHTSLEVVPA